MTPCASADEFDTLTWSSGSDFDKKLVLSKHACRVGWNRIYTPCMIVHIVLSLIGVCCIRRVYMYACMVLANPAHLLCVRRTRAISLGLARTVYVHRV